MADGKVVIETDLDSSGIEKGLKSLGSITAKGLKAATTAIAGTATALGGVATAAVKVGSDFEAQMSRVKAISGATGEEFEKLRNQAIELGADTAFSASEAAQGMENLAAAGFTTNEIMSAMPGMLDLAAASGEDLANSADIAASTLRGFGLEASEAGHVADVLAENANRTNSSVAETGEAMKYIAPLARAAGISMEETAAAIGIMANAGIQGSQAGTTLRGALSRLSKPTDVMQQAMDELGVSFYDSEGKMKSLADQVGMLQDAMEGMTDEQKNNYLVTLYGQEALSGMLALINEGPESLSDLTEAYEVCDGAAQKAATTMQDNLKGAVEALSGSAETLGIVFYDSVSGSLKDAVQVVNESVDNITDAFNNGGLNEAISAAGDEFANLATEAASHAPEMVDVAVDFIQSFTSGIVDNRRKLIDAAGEAAEAVASGFAEVLPPELQEPVEDAIDAISKSFESGGLKKAGKSIEDTLENVIDVVGDLSEALLTLSSKTLDFVGENFAEVASSAAALYTAFKGYKTIDKFTKSSKLASTAVKVLSGEMKLAEIATAAWNKVLNANPVALVASAVAALGAAVLAYRLTTKDLDQDQEEFNRRMEELDERVSNTRDSLDGLKESIGDTFGSMQSSVANLDRLQSELDGAFDSTGKVKEGCEALANSILYQLNEAMGTEYSLTADGFIKDNDGIIQSLDQVNGSIDEYVQKLKQKSISEAAASQYADAVQAQAEAQDNLNTAYQEYLDALSEYKSQVGGNDTAAYDQARENLEKTQQALQETSQVVEEAQANVSGLDEVMNLLGEGTPESVQKAVDAYSRLPEEASKAADGIVASQDIIEQLLSSTDYSRMVSGFQLAIEQMQESGGQIPESMQHWIADAIRRIDGLTPEARETAIMLLQTMMSGMSEQIPEFENLATMTSDEVISTFRQYLIDSGALNSIGIESVNDLVSGMGSQKETADAKGKEISESVNSNLGSADTGSTGADAVTEYSGGMTGNIPAAVAAATGVAQAADNGLDSADTKTTGSAAAKDYSSGIESGAGSAKSAGEELAENAESGADTADSYSAGSNFGSGFVNGIGSWIKSAASKAAELAKSAYDAVTGWLDEHSPSRKTRQAGAFFGQGFVLGVNDEIKSSEKASEKLADAALKSLDMSAISSRMRETMALNTDRIAKSFALESTSTILSKQQTENMMKLSDADIERLAVKLGKATADGVSRSQSNRPIYLGTDRIDKPLPKGAVPRI